MHQRTGALAIIPARGGSKGIPRKNVRPLAGLPLIAHTIREARSARLVARVAVSTDDAEIAAVSERAGAEVIWRPAELADDAARSEDALLHALDALESGEGYRPEVLAFLQCTSPLTAAADIDGTLRALAEQRADSAFSAVPFHYFLWKCGPDGGVVGVNHDLRQRLRRQDREPEYLETGAVYAMRVSGFRAARHRFFGRVAMHLTPPERWLEIDEPADFARAEQILAERGPRPPVGMPTPLDALVLDFDGVFTDNAVYVAQDGTETVRCDRGDGLGLSMLRQAGLPILVLSKERNPVVHARCAKLGIPCLSGVDDKLPVLTRWLNERGLSLARTIYIGNDANDVECLRAVGYGAAPADAYPEAHSAAALVLSRPGGRGAIRELTGLIHAHLEASRGAHA